MGNCGKRAFEAGLRFAGIKDSVGDLQTSNDIRDTASKYGLTYIENGELKAGNYPVLVLYQDNKEFTDSEWHAVFLSDIAPVRKYKIHSIIIGWEKI